MNNNIFDEFRKDAIQSYVDAYRLETNVMEDIINYAISISNTDDDIYNDIFDYYADNERNIIFEALDVLESEGLITSEQKPRIIDAIDDYSKNSPGFMFDSSYDEDIPFKDFVIAIQNENIMSL